MSLIEEWPFSCGPPCVFLFSSYMEPDRFEERSLPHSTSKTGPVAGVGTPLQMQPEALASAPVQGLAVDHV
jgi:hypothetical protein